MFLRAASEDLKTAVARASLQLAFMANQAYQMLHAISITLVRLVITHHRLLEWETAAASATRGGPPDVRVFLRGMVAGPSIALASLVLVSLAQPRALPVALPVLAVWAAAPLIAFVLSRPMPARRVALGAEDREFLRQVARSTWRYFETFMGAEDHGLPPDNVQAAPELTIAHRTSPTNIGMGLLATLAAHDFGFIGTDDLIGRIETTFDTVDGLERFEGHLLNWYDTRSLAPLPPAYVSTVDSGNLAAALLTLAVGLRRLPGAAAGSAQRDRLEALARRAEASFDGMNFRFLYDTRRHLFAIGYRLADAEGPGRLDESFYDLLASEARLASFIAIAKGDVPELHWFHLGRSVTSVRGRPVLLSWNATMFEYLLPLLVMRSYPETLLDESCRMVVRRQMDYAASRGVPWGISESAYNLVDRHDTYQYKAFGVPGLGLKRGLGDELVVAPYATALAAMIDPTGSAANLRRLAALGLESEHGFFDAIDYTNREPDHHEHGPGEPARSKGVVVRTCLAHHEGMTLIALANALLGEPMVERFHAEPRVQATELLLQERVPRRTPTADPRPLDDVRVAAPLPAMPVRRYRSPHTVFPHAQFLSNGTYVTVVTNAGGGASFWRGLAVTRSRHDSTCDPGSQFIYLRDVWSGSTWSATYHPTDKEPDDYVATFLAERATFHRRDGEVSTQLDVAVSTEDDVEVRRVTVTNHGARMSARSTSRAMPRSCWRRRPPTSLTRPSASSSSRRSTFRRAPRSSAIGGLETPASRARGRCTCSAWRAGRRDPSNGKPIARASSVAGGRPTTRRRSTAVPCLGRRASCSTRSSACGNASGCPRGRPCGSRSPRAWRRTVRRPSRSRRSTTIPVRRREPLPSPSPTRRAACVIWASRARRRSSSSDWPRGCCSRTRRFGRARTPSRRTSSARPVCGRTASRATCPSCSCVSSKTTTCRSYVRSCRRRSTGASRASSPTS